MNPSIITKRICCSNLIKSKALLVLGFLSCLSWFNSAAAQTLPDVVVGSGGVNFGSSLAIWYDASDIDGDDILNVDDGDAPSTGDGINLWVNRANPGVNDAVFRGAGNDAPALYNDTDGINGAPVLDFNISPPSGNFDTGSIYSTSFDLRPMTTPNATFFLVYRPDSLNIQNGGGGNGTNGQGVFGIDNGEFDRFFISYIELSGGDLAMELMMVQLVWVVQV